MKYEAITEVRLLCDPVQRKHGLGTVVLVKPVVERWQNRTRIGLWMRDVEAPETVYDATNKLTRT